MAEVKFTPPKGPVVLCILDGFGHRDASEANAIAQANTPTFDHLWAEGPHALIETSGVSVGLPDGQMGNSEVGHMNIGAGRVVMQDLPRIDAAIADGSLAINPELIAFTQRLKASGGACHLMGLVSPGGVHSHQDHMVMLAKVLHQAGLKVWLHAFLDGRDTPPRSAKSYIEKLIRDLGPTATIATMTGRYFAMDRDHNWDRVARAYKAITLAQGNSTRDFPAALDACYAQDETDEFVSPHVAQGFTGMAENDGILMANFRADRAREILSSLADPAFDGFERPAPAATNTLGMVEYSSAHNAFMPALFPSLALANTLGEFVAKAGKKQLRIAETEKYAHVTFFLNGGREETFAGETRILIPSPKVATYDLQPEMSAPEVTDQLVEAIKSGAFDLIVVNYANPDMVGHTGILAAAITAIETIDLCLNRLCQALKEAEGVMLITADHGNVELMQDPSTGAPHTAHTTLEVPLVLAGGASLKGPIGLRSGRLADIAPTLLTLMSLTPPPEMTGTVLITSPTPS